MTQGVGNILSGFFNFVAQAMRSGVFAKMLKSSLNELDAEGREKLEQQIVSFVEKCRNTAEIKGQ